MSLKSLTFFIHTPIFAILHAISAPPMVLVLTLVYRYKCFDHASSSDISNPWPAVSNCKSCFLQTFKALHFLARCIKFRLIGWPVCLFAQNVTYTKTGTGNKTNWQRLSWTCGHDVESEVFKCSTRRITRTTLNGDDWNHDSQTDASLRATRLLQKKTYCAVILNNCAKIYFEAAFLCARRSSFLYIRPCT